MVSHEKDGGSLSCLIYQLAQYTSAHQRSKGCCHWGSATHGVCEKSDRHLPLLRSADAELDLAQSNSDLQKLATKLTRSTKGLAALGSCSTTAAGAAETGPGISCPAQIRGRIATRTVSLSTQDQSQSRRCSTSASNSDLLTWRRSTGVQPLSF
jgi:hypothetical protein